KSLLAAGGAGLAPWLAHPATAVRFGALALLVTGGVAVFGALAQGLGGASLADLKGFLKRPAAETPES
ncbi:lipid II flippase MurJ, partial [Azospirillum doebereinerae]|nr:lipid II flippase MurJ [Azospirillum doebereinerae]